MSILVSVIIPTYKRSDYIVRAINSVLKQTYKNIEIIVVDDNDKNDKFSFLTEKKLEKYIQDRKIKYVKHLRNKGISAARNTGIEMALGDYISFLDDDDEFCEDKTKLQIEVFQKAGKEVGLVYGSCLKIDTDSNKKKIIKPKIKGNVFDILGINYIGTPSIVMVSRSAIEKIKGFDVNLNHKEDIDFYFRLSEYFEVSYTPEIVSKYYVHSGSASKNHHDRLVKMLRFLQKHKDKIKQPRLRWSELQERLAELYIFNNNKIKAFKSLSLAYFNRPSKVSILLKISLLFLGRKIFLIKRRITNYFNFF